MVAGGVPGWKGPPTQGNTIRQEAEGPLLTGLPLGELRLVCSAAGRSGLGSEGPDFKWKHGLARSSSQLPLPRAFRKKASQCFAA